MIIPSNDVCVAVIDQMLTEGFDLTEWEESFCESNCARKEFTDRQKEIIAKFMDKYDFKNLPR
jgi:hypothetical protein